MQGEPMIVETGSKRRTNRAETNHEIASRLTSGDHIDIDGIRYRVSGQTRRSGVTRKILDAINTDETLVLLVRESGIVEVSLVRESGETEPEPFYGRIMEVSEVENAGTVALDGFSKAGDR